jgi:hypothetical protein
MNRRILVSLCDPIEKDGRVKRTCSALSLKFNVKLICIQGGKNFSTSDYEIRRVNLSYISNSALRVFFFWFCFIFEAIRTKPDYIYANDFYLPFPAWIISKLIRTKVVFDSHELIIPTLGVPMETKEKFFYTLEKLVINDFHLVIAANIARANFMYDHYKLASVPLVLQNIPPVPESVLSNEEILELYPKLRKNNISECYVVYMGDINFERGIKLLVDSAYYLPENYKLVFVGGGPDFIKLKDLEFNNGDRLRVIGPIPHAHIFDVIRQFDIGFVTYSMNTLNNIYCAPNKIFEYAQAFLPVVSTCQPTIKSIFEDFCIGQLLGCDSQLSSKSLALSIEAVVNNKDYHLSEIERFLSKYTWQNEIMNLLRVLNQ